MKWLVVCLVVVAFVLIVEARGGRNRNHNRDRTWTWTPCVPVDENNRCHGGRKNGTCAGSDCTTSTYTDRRCRPEGCPRQPHPSGRCKYSVNKTAGIPDCDLTTNTRLVSMYLKRGDTATCPATKQRTLPCGGRKHGQGHGRGHGRGGRRRNARDTAIAVAGSEGRRGCKYAKGDWSDCGDDGMKSRTLTLRPESRGSCEQQKQQKKPCSKAEKGARKAIKKQARKEKRKQRKEDKAARKAGNADTDRHASKVARKEERKQRRQERTEARQNGCKYSKAEWSQCDTVSNMQNKTVQLRKGEQSQCQTSRTFTRTCKTNCKYVKSTWGDCLNAERKRVLTLESGDSTCSATLEKTRPCINAKGKEQCFYTPWSVWGPCQNNVQTKTRTMTSGGDRCNKHKKTVKTRGCEA